MDLLKMLNLGLRFFLELCVLVIFGYWGYKTGGSSIWMKLVLGIGSPILFAIVWGIFLAPKMLHAAGGTMATIAGIDRLWLELLGTVQYRQDQPDDCLWRHLYNQ